MDTTRRAPHPAADHHGEQSDSSAATAALANVRLESGGGDAFKSVLNPAISCPGIHRRGPRRRRACPWPRRARARRVRRREARDAPREGPTSAGAGGGVVHGWACQADVSDISGVSVVAGPLRLDRDPLLGVFGDGDAVGVVLLLGMGGRLQGRAAAVRAAASAAASAVRALRELVLGLILCLVPLVVAFFFLAVREVVEYRTTAGAASPRGARRRPRRPRRRPDNPPRPKPPPPRPPRRRRRRKEESNAPSVAEQVFGDRLGDDGTGGRGGVHHGDGPGGGVAFARSVLCGRVRRPARRPRGRLVGGRGGPARTRRARSRRLGFARRRLRRRDGGRGVVVLGVVGGVGRGRTRRGSGGGKMEEEEEEEEEDRVSRVTSAASSRVSRSSAASIVARGLPFVIVRIVVRVRVRRAGGVVRTRGRVSRRGGLGIRAVVVVVAGAHRRVGAPTSPRARDASGWTRRGACRPRRRRTRRSAPSPRRRGRRRGSIDWIPFVRSRRYRRLRRQHHRRLQQGRLDDAPAARERGRRPGVHERERREQRDEHEREDGPDTRHPEGLRARLLCTSACNADSSTPKGETFVAVTKTC